MADGYVLDTPLAKILWMSSQTVHRPAWELLGQEEPNEAWLSWVLEMNTLYPVGSLKFERPSTVAERTKFQTTSVAWSDVLCGRALARFNGKFIVPGLREASIAWAKAERRPLPTIGHGEVNNGNG